MNQLTKLPPAWHAEAIELLNKNFSAINSAFLDATKRAVWLGIFLNEIKRRGKEDKSIPHGSFGAWLKQNAPDISWNRANEYMHIGREVCQKGNFQIVDYPQFVSGELPPPALKLIEGKTQKQLFLEFKQVDANGDPRVGRQAGSEGGRKLSTSEQADKARAKALEDSGRMGFAIKDSNANFFLLTDVNDLEVEAQIAVLESAIKLRKTWLRTPRAKRDAKLIESMIQHESPLK